MNKVVIFLILISTNIFSQYLTIDDDPIGSALERNIVSNNFIQQFTNNSLKAGMSTAVHTIPIYIKSDSSQDISMTISSLPNLKNTIDNQEISTSFFYRQADSNEIPIQRGIPFRLSSNSLGREGNTIIGYIIVRLNTLSTTQTVGNYNLATTFQVNIGNNSSNSSTFSIGANVPLLAIASFQEISALQDGKKFNNSSIDYGNFNFGQKNEIIKELFVKSNSNQNFKISFETNDLTHILYPEHRITMRYIYTLNNGQETVVNNSNYFIAISGKNNGSKVGQMNFQTETINTSHIAGEYRASINVTITLE